MPWDVYELLKGGGSTKPDPLDYGDPIAYAEAENTYRHRTEDAIELERLSKRAPDAVITVQITLTEHGDARVLPR
jgi:hypothetical protein